MRSFSILVIAWFFACLVLVEGVELDSDLKGLGDSMRLRLNHKDYRTMSTSKDTFKSTLQDEHINVDDSKTNNKIHGFRKGGSGFQKKTQGSSSKLDSQRMEQKGITAINTFYSLPIGIRPHKAIKYPTSHYEVHLGIGPKTYPNAAALIAYENETSRDAAETTVRLGGEDFHTRVFSAAVEANKQFGYNTNLAADPRALCNAFYSLLYNSRQMYAVMITAMRCQNMVNAQDEDNVWLAPLFSDHVNGKVDFKNTALPNPQPVREFAYSQSRSQVYYDQAFNRTTLNLSSAVSNAHWANLWSTLQTFLRLPKNWKTWCRDLFLSVKVVKPSDFDVSPRFVVLWPDAQYAYFDQSQGHLDLKYEYVGTWFNLINDLNTGSCSVDWNNVGISSQLEAALENCSTYFNLVAATYPQLQIMFDLLGCTNSLDFNYQRDIMARTVYVDDSWDISKLIYASATGVAAYTNSSNSVISTYHGENFVGRQQPPKYWIRKDSQFKTQSKPITTHFDGIQGPAFTYVDATTVSEALQLLLTDHIAPISFKFYKITDYNNNLDDFQYIRQPLINVGSIFRVVQVIGGQTGYQSKDVLHRDYEDYLSACGRGRVLPRQLIWARAFTNATALITSTSCTSGVFPIEQDAVTNELLTYDVKSMSDYLVPDMTAVEAINDYLDKLAVTVKS